MNRKTNLTFSQLVDIKQIRRLLEAHYKTTGMLSAILDTDENILVAVGWQDICTRFHRANPATLARCRESDSRVKEHLGELKDGFLDYRCGNGLRDVAMPILIEGEHLATFFLGQFFYDDELPDSGYFRNQARECGFDEEAYLEALCRVPVMTRDQVRDILEYYRILVDMLAETGLKNLRLTREVEDRKRAEKEASFFRSLIEYTRDPVYALDPSDGWRMIYVNQAACAHFGIDRERMLTMRIPDWDPAFDMSKIDSMWQNQKAGKPARFETLHRVASGKLVPVEVTANYLVHDGKELSVGYFHDISRRKAMEEALRESERNLIEAQRIARIGNWTSDPSGNILSASPELYRIFGITPDKAAEKLDVFLETVHPDDRLRIHSTIDLLLQNRLAGSLEFRILRLNGDERTVLLQMEPALDVQGRSVRMIGTAQDVTEQRAVMRELREKDLMLLQQSRLATMGELVNYVAHQWRQPLNIIGLLVQAMKSDCASGECTEEVMEHTVEQILGLVRHMSATIDDFRDFFRAEKEAVPFNLKELARKTVSFISDTLNLHGIELTLDAEEDLVHTGYPNELSHVLLNILNNAREALSERGVESPRISILIRREGERKVVTIRDNAGGIPPDIFGRLFEPYATTKESGTGIGLYMSKTIIEKRMHGRITAANIPGGAEFRIEL